MESSKIKRVGVRRKRTFRVRKRLKGSFERPRISVIRTNQHIHVQAIDDDKKVTLANASTLSLKERKGCESGKKLGMKIAEELKKQEVSKAIFDRGRFKYHGVVAAVAEGAREGGLEL